MGNTLEEIAREKAGIIKRQIPVVISEFHPLTAPVFKQVALEKESEIYFANSLEVPYTMDLKGGYQAKNIKGIVQTLRVLQQKGWKITEEHIQKDSPISWLILTLWGAGNSWEKPLRQYAIQLIMLMDLQKSSPNCSKRNTTLYIWYWDLSRKKT